MKNFRVLLAIIFSSSILVSQNTFAQSSPTITEVHNFLNGKRFLVTYREGGVAYGTYYFTEIHYCRSGNYGLVGKSVKKTVLGNEQNNNWQEAGIWKIINYNNSVGIYYKTNMGQVKFFPAYRSRNGGLSFGEGVSVVLQGKANCN